MVRRLVRRSAALAAAATLLFAGSTFADSVAADGDQLAGVQTFVDLGVVAPGATVQRDVDMTLFCGGLRHVDPGQIVTVFPVSSTVPPGGTVTATTTWIGPVPPGWANDTAGVSGCSGPMSVTASTPSHVTIVAPLTPGLDYDFSLEYSRSLSPAGVSDGSSVSGFTMVTFRLDVAETEVPDTTPPTFDTEPGDLDLVTGDPAGVVLDYAAPTASDDRDPSPVVACDPASGASVPVGLTTVTCTATDATGNHASTSFDVDVHLAVVTWDDPVHGTEVSANRGRTLPLKVRAWLDGAPLAGPATFEVWACDGGAAPERTLDATPQSDPTRWMASLDTSGLSVGCHKVAFVADGSSLGSFTLNVVDSPGAGSAKGKANRPR